MIVDFEEVGEVEMGVGGDKNALSDVAGDGEDFEGGDALGEELDGFCAGFFF